MLNCLLESWSLRLSVESLEDYLLVDEVSFICENDEVDRVIYRFIKTGILSESDREFLVRYYVFYNSEEYLEE